MMTLNTTDPTKPARTLLTALLLAPLAALHAATPAAKPNIVFIFSDDYAVQTIGAYGARLSDFCKQQGVTPNIDKLTAQGGFFVGSFCGNSLCAPSRASVLTGMLGHANGVQHKAPHRNWLPPTRCATWLL